jgi:methyl-accepting chemotaxis protein
VVTPPPILYRKITHPLVRFRRTFEQIEAGSLPAGFRIRARDYLHREAEAFDAMLAGLGARVGAIHDAHEALSTRIAALGGTPPVDDDARTWLHELERLDKDLSDAIAAVRPEES